MIPLLLDEATTQQMSRFFASDPAMIAWWAASVECASAVARRARAGAVPEFARREALARLGELSSTWQEIEPSDEVRDTAIRLLQTHELRTADALQLAAAFAAAEGRPQTLRFVSLDSRLNQAAGREGFELPQI